MAIKHFRTLIQSTCLMSFFIIHTTAKKEKADGLKKGEFVRFQFATIRSATANFSVSNRLGEGTLGVVYKGTLKSGEEVAIRRLSHNIDLNTEMFVIESRIVARVQHTNLVKLLGFCSERADIYVVYEYLPNANLSCLLLDPSKKVLINWETWYKLILGIAKGLEYLHVGTNAGMVHRNLSTNNVLLDKEMNPKIADFGLNVLFASGRQRTNTCSTAIGTFGYIAPEYIYTGWYTSKSDVYSFGVIVLETVSDLKKKNFNKSSITNVDRKQFRKLWDEDRLSDMINPALSSRCSETDVIRCIQIGILCVQEDAEHRPTMTEVIQMLTGNVAIPLPLTPTV